MRTTGRTAEQILAEVATQSKGVATREELMDAGLSSDSIGRRVRKGLLIPEFPGVYRVGHRAASTETAFIAAVKACGEGAVLSGLAAAYLYGLIRGDAPEPEVTALTERCIDGVLTHRARAGIDPRDKSSYRDIPVTTIPRTLVDVTARLDHDRLIRAVHESCVRFRLRPERVEAVLARRSNTPGAALLRSIVRGDATIVLSRLEKGFIKLLMRERFPLPQTNRRTGAHWVDCRWPALRLTVELDSYAFHNSRHSWEQDRQREREARARGDAFRRYTWTDVFEDPAPMIEELRGLASNRYS